MDTRRSFLRVLFSQPNPLEVGNCGDFHELPFAALFPGASRVKIAVVAFAGGIVEELNRRGLGVGAMAGRC